MCVCVRVFFSICEIDNQQIKINYRSGFRHLSDSLFIFLLCSLCFFVGRQSCGNVVRWRKERIILLWRFCRRSFCVEKQGIAMKSGTTAMSRSSASPDLEFSQLPFECDVPGCDRENTTSTTSIAHLFDQNFSINSRGAHCTNV